MEKQKDKSDANNSVPPSAPISATASANPPVSTAVAPSVTSSAASTPVATPQPAPVGWYFSGGGFNLFNYPAWALGWDPVKNSASGAGPVTSDAAATSNATVGSTTPNQTQTPVASNTATPKNK